MQRDSAHDQSAPELAAFLAEAVESKRSARERLMRSIRLQQPELAESLSTQLPISPCKLDSDSAPVEPLSRFVLGQLGSAGHEASCSTPHEA